MPELHGNTDAALELIGEINRGVAVWQYFAMR
jgi:hypothetical protein